MGAAIKNPSGEVLSYTWTLYVTPRGSEIKLYESSAPSFELYGGGNSALSTSDCRITLRVGAPILSRSK